MAKCVLAILSIFICNQSFAQKPDTLFNRDFDHFRGLTDSLISELHSIGITNASELQTTRVSPKAIYYCDTIRKQLKLAYSHGVFEFKIASYFDNGKPARGQDFSSPVAQLQCSYSMFAEEFRKAGNIHNEIVSVLNLNNWLKNGFPETKYCPYVYAPVEVNFGKPKPAFNNSLPRKDSTNNQ